MDKKQTKIQTALTFVGCVRCICGEKMELHEKETWDDMTTQFYFQCPTCKKWTGLEKIHSNLPIAQIMERINLIQRRMQPVNGGMRDGNQ